MKPLALAAMLLLNAGILAADTPAPEDLRRAYDAILPAMVALRVQVNDDPAAFYEERAAIDGLFDEVARQRMELDLAGVRVTPQGAVLLRDPNLPLRRYGRIEAIDHAGRAVVMRVAAVFENHAALLLEPVEPAVEKLSYITFQAASVQPGDQLLLAHTTFLERSLCVRVTPVRAGAVAVRGAPDLAQAFWWAERPDALNVAVPSLLTLVLDRDGRPVGAAFDESLWNSDSGISSWVGEAVMADHRISTDSLTAMEETIKAFSRRSVKEVEVHFRNDSPIVQQRLFEEGRLTHYGLLLNSAGRLLVPTELDRDAVRQIDKLIVRDGERQIEAEFRGLYRDMGVILIEAPGIGGEPVALSGPAAFPRAKLFYALSVQRRYGQRQDEVQYNRYLDVATGYKNISYPVARRPMRVGDLVLDGEGHPLGFFAPMRREERDEIIARQARRGQALPREARIFLFADIASQLDSSTAHLDPVARPMTRREEQALLWLGVEYQPLTPPIARVMGVESATRGGSRGLLVTSIYARSPAERLDIKPRDILLAIAVPGAQGEIDLTVPPRSPEARFHEGQAQVTRPWRPRRNYLTSILSILGEGREVRLRLLREGEERIVNVALEKAPEDFEGAPQFEDQALGLLVKDLTYEVRAVLRLSPEAPGVVVADVLPGSKAALAQIRPFEVIALVNGQPVASAADFERLTRAAAAGKGRIELLLTLMGQSRLVELDGLAGLL